MTAEPIQATQPADPLRAAIAAGPRIIDLAQPLFTGMPGSPNHPAFQMALQRRHGDLVRPDGGSAANEIIVTGGHVGTHIDALAHVSHDGLLHGGADAREAVVGGRFAVHGVETVEPLIRPGTLLDVARLRGTGCLPPGHGVGAEELDAAARAAGVRPVRGGVCLVRTGWSTLWPDAQRYLGRESGVPGVTEDGARWLAGFGPAAVGADTTAFERIAPGAGHAVLPGHRVLLVEHGIHIIEHLRLEELAETGVAEFTAVVVPLKIVGATGSPVRPLALLPAPDR
ncbi:MAG: cyclase family protein [Catenulispora sp.]